MTKKSILNNRDERVCQLIIENNLKECKRIYEQAKNCSQKEISKKRPLCHKIVLYTMKGYNLSNPKQLLDLHKKGIIFLGLGEIRECFKIVAESNQTFFEVD